MSLINYCRTNRVQVIGFLSGAAIGGTFVYNKIYQLESKYYKIVPRKVLIGPTIFGSVVGGVMFPVTLTLCGIGLLLTGVGNYLDWSDQVLQEANKHKK